MRALPLIAALVGGFAMGGGCGRSGTNLKVGAGGGGAAGGLSASGGALTTAPADTDGSTGSGGITGIGGGSTSSGGAGGACANVPPCGGDVFGTWTVTSSCLQVSGEVDMIAAAGLSCPTGMVEGSLYVTGMWTADSDGTYADDTATEGYNVFDLPPECKELAGTNVSCDTVGRLLAESLGYASVSAMDAVHGGCMLLATVQQKGGVGLVLRPRATPSGHYATSGSLLKMTEDGTEYSYCVSGNTMTWTPRGRIGAITGTVVFQRGGSPGTGGTGGGPGAGGADGGPGTGGADGSPDARCTGDLATVAAWGFACADSLCTELLRASNCDVSLQSAIRVSRYRGTLTYDISDTEGKACWYIGGRLSGAAAWDNVWGFCNRTSATIVAGTYGTTNYLSPICERGSSNGTGGAVGSGNDAGSQVIPPAQCWNRMEDTCYPCCPDPLPDCTDKPDGYPYPCVVSGGNDWCVCKCWSGRWQCGC